MALSALVLFIFGLLFNASAFETSGCNLDAALVNQDPYPGLPDSYVKAVFQITGLENPDCKKASFEIVEEFPFSLDPGVKNKIEIIGGAYIRDFESAYLIPYKLRINKDALDGDNTIKAILQFEKSDGQVVTQIEQFEINIEGIKVDFEVSVKEFDPLTNTLTFEILNIGEDNVEGLAVEIPKQEVIAVKGPNRNVVGDLDSNEETTFKYEALPKDGEIELRILYTDSLHERHALAKKVLYDTSYFTNRKKDEKKPLSPYFYTTIGLIAIWIILWIRKRWKKKKLKEKERRYELESKEGKHESKESKHEDKEARHKR